MPVMSGVETARELRRIGCPIFIVGATGNALKEDQEEVSSTAGDIATSILTVMFSPAISTSKPVRIKF